MHPEHLAVFAAQRRDELLASARRRRYDWATPVEERSSVQRGTFDAFITSIYRRGPSSPVRFWSDTAA